MQPTACTVVKFDHPEHPGRLLAATLLAVNPGTKPHHFGDVMFTTGKLLSPNVYFQIENGKLT
jgi:hypothetical protein